MSPQWVESGRRGLHYGWMDAQPDDVFFAEQIGLPRRRYWITRDRPVTSNTRVRGWAFIYEEMDGQGEWRPGWDTWEEWFFEILRYPPEYSSQELIWQREGSEEVVDLASLQPVFEGKRATADQTPETAGLRLT